MCSAFLSLFCESHVQTFADAPPFVFAVGRTYAYGLAAAGQAGVEAVIKTILAEFELTLGLAGHRSVADIVGRAGEVTVKVES